jgi:hypothetical protein
MVVVEDQCCDCAAPGYPCRGSLCPNRHVEVHYCDHCGYEIEDEVHEVDGEEFCSGCYEKLFENETEEE